MVLDVRELMRRVQAGETDRAIARGLKVARKTVAVTGVRSWPRAARQNGLSANTARHHRRHRASVRVLSPSHARRCRTSARGAPAFNAVIATSAAPM